MQGQKHVLGAWMALLLNVRADESLTASLGFADKVITMDGDGGVIMIRHSEVCWDICCRVNANVKASLE